MKIYIAGPITGVAGYKEHFEATEQAVLKAGHEVINPAKILAEMPSSTTHKQYMDVCYALLAQADGVLFLEGWEHSMGAEMEFKYATRMKKIICFEGGAF